MAAESASPRAPLEWQFADRVYVCDGTRPLWMGILNATPDSFSDGGALPTVEAALARAQALVAEGADLLDVGGESTRPGSTPVALEEELRRVIPVVEAVAAACAVPVSIDTTKAAVARRALAAGAEIVNDISGLTFDPEMPGVCASAGCGVIAMHIQGTPATMQLAPAYHDVVSEVRDWLAARLDALEQAGVPRARIVLDPGIGFGKTAEHNVALLRNIAALRALGRPILIGHSRKRFVGKILAQSGEGDRPVDERGGGTIGVSLAALARGADLLRLHEIAPSRDAWRAWTTISGGSHDRR